MRSKCLDTAEVQTVQTAFADSPTTRRHGANVTSRTDHSWTQKRYAISCILERRRSRTIATMMSVGDQLRESPALYRCSGRISSSPVSKTFDVICWLKNCGLTTRFARGCHCWTMIRAGDALLYVAKLTPEGAAGSGSGWVFFLMPIGLPFKDTNRRSSLRCR